MPGHNPRRLFAPRQKFGSKLVVNHIINILLMFWLFRKWRNFATFSYCARTPV